MSTLGGKKKMLNVHVCAECRLALVKMVMVYTVNVGNMLKLSSHSRISTWRFLLIHLILQKADIRERSGKSTCY